MGTRNITRVILPNGSVIVNQYCQWDGYPTGQGAEVMNFVRQYCTKAKIEELKKRLDNSVLFTARNGNDNCSCTGAKFTAELEELNRSQYQSGFESYDKLLEEGKISKDQLRSLMQVSRDFGPRILYWLAEQEPEGMAFYTDDCCYNVTIKSSWRIEGVYIIDLSKNKVTIGYHGKCRTYSFKKVCAMTAEEVEKEMDALQKYIDSDEEA